MVQVGDCRTTHEIYPRADAHLLARLHHLQSFIQQHFPSQGIVNDFNYSVGKGKPSSGGVLLHAHTTSECQLDDYTAPESVGYIVIPKGQVAL